LDEAEEGSRKVCLSFRRRMVETLDSFPHTVLHQNWFHNLAYEISALARISLARSEPLKPDPLRFLVVELSVIDPPLTVTVDTPLNAKRARSTEKSRTLTLRSFPTGRAVRVEAYRMRRPSGGTLSPRPGKSP
jgi:hypothetical protein